MEKHRPKLLKYLIHGPGFANRLWGSDRYVFLCKYCGKKIRIKEQKKYEILWNTVFIILCISMSVANTLLSPNLHLKGFSKFLVLVGFWLFVFAIFDIIMYFILPYEEIKDDPDQTDERGKPDEH